MAKFAGLIGGALLLVASIWVPALAVPGMLMLGMGAISALTAPDAPSIRNARAAELQMATSASGVPVPVFFGEQRLTGNFMQYDKEQLRTVEIRESSPGGKGGGGGGGSQVVGYEYFLTYEYGLCMGEVDGVAQVISTPGETKLIDERPEIATTTAAATVATQFTRPGTVGGTVEVTLNSSENLAVNNQVNIAEKGNFTVTAVDVDNITVTLRLDEKLGTQQGGYQVATVPVESVLNHINPTATSATRKMAFDDASEFVEGETITLNGFGEWTVTTAISGTSANLTLTRITGTGPIIVGTVVTATRDASQMFGAANDTMDVTLTGTAEGGTVKLYRGTEWQTRVGGASDPYAANGMNYRPICWALFMDYKIGSHPQAQSHHWILRRLPKCLRDDGTTFTALKTRGSNTTTNVNYWQANPAAIIYEILTNKTWGRGMSSSLFDEASWQSVSEFFATQNIGLGITLDRADKLANILSGIRETARILLLWDGAKLKIRTLLDTETIHRSIVTLTKSQVNNVKFTRPSWTNTFNEVRSEYANRARNYKADSVAVQDVANFNTVGILNTKAVSLAGVADVTLAQRLASLILKESSYPLGALTFEMNRTASHLEPGDIIRFIWDEWSEGTVTSYFQVSTVKNGGSEREMITVQATEDPDLSAIEAEETSITPPTTLNWNNVTGAQDSDLRLTPPQQANTLPILPLAVLEVPAIVTEGKENRLAFLGQKPIAGLTGIAAHAAQFDGDFKYIGTAATFSVTGKLLNSYAAGPEIDRTLGFEFSLNDASADEAKVLQVATVVADADHLSALTNSAKDFIVIGEEIMMAGKITKLSTNRFKAINLVRGLFGTRIADVPAGATFFYSRTMPDGIKAETLEMEEETRFRGYPVDAKGVANVGGDIYIAHADPWNRKFVGLGIRPLAPEPYSIADTAGEKTIRVRPQFYDRGAAILTVQRASELLLTNIGAMKFMAEALDGSSAVLQGRTLIAHTFTPDTLDDVATGMVEIVYTPPGGTALINIYAELDGEISIRAAAFSV